MGEAVRACCSAMVSVASRKRWGLLEQVRMIWEEAVLAISVNEPTQIMNINTIWHSSTGMNREGMLMSRDTGHIVGNFSPAVTVCTLLNSLETFTCSALVWICSFPRLRSCYMTWWGCWGRDVQGADRDSSSSFSACQTEHCWQVEVPEINYRSQCGGGEREKRLALECLWVVGMKRAYREKSIL